MRFYSNITYTFIIWVGAILTVAFLGFSQIPGSGKFEHNFIKSLANWDGGHYLGIAQFGYSEKFQYAFFPLYPLLIKLVSNFTQNYLLSAVLISITSTFLGLHLFYKLVLQTFNKKIAQDSVIYLLFFPASFFLIIAYSEGLFFFLTILTFYLFRRNKILWASLAAILVSATRLVGLAVVIAIWIEIITTQGFNRKNWYMLFAPLGFLLYCVYLLQQTGDPLYFISAQNHWQRELSLPWIGFWETLKNIFTPGYILTNFNIFLDFTLAIFGLGLAIRAFRFLPTSFAFYSLFSVSIPLFTPTLSSMPRYLIVVFPIFILIALIKNTYVKLTITIFSLMLLGIFTTLFINGYWVS